MKRSTFLASIAAIILAPFGVKAFKSDYSNESTVALCDGHLYDVWFNGQPRSLIYEFQPNAYVLYEKDNVFYFCYTQIDKDGKFKLFLKQSTDRRRTWKDFPIQHYTFIQPAFIIENFDAYFTTSDILAFRMHEGVGDPFNGLCGFKTYDGVHHHNPERVFRP